jgi:hypothetical protein
MGTIKLKRGTGSPAGSLAQYEVAMDVAAQKLYVSSNGTDAVILANKYDDADADARVNLQTGANLDLSSKSTSDLSEGTNEYFTDARAINAIESASSLTLNGTIDTDDTLTAMGGFTVDSTGATPGDSYNNSLFAKRQIGGSNGNNAAADGSGNRTIATVWRDLDSEVINTFYDNRGPSLDFVLQSDSQGTTQYLGGIAMQSGSDAGQDGHYIEGWSYDTGQAGGYATKTIFQANEYGFYPYGRLQAIQSATFNNRIPWDTSIGDDEAPIVVKADWDNSDAVAAEFWNMTNNDENKIKVHFGTDDAGSKTYHNEIRSGKAGTEKSLQFNALADTGDVEDTMYQITRDDSDGSLTHDFFGKVDVTVDGEDFSQMMTLGANMLNRSQIYINSLTTRLDFKTDPIPNNAEVFQSFSVKNDADGTKPIGNFGAKYSSANSGELSEMRLIAQDHNFNEKEIGVNQRNAYTNAPFQFVNLNQTEINALTSVGAGTVVYNGTDNKLQVYAGGSWVDLH